MHGLKRLQMLMKLPNNDVAMHKGLAGCRYRVQNLDMVIATVATLSQLQTTQQ
jgi:hypothetical protein